MHTVHTHTHTHSRAQTDSKFTLLFLFFEAGSLYITLEFAGIHSVDQPDWPETQIPLPLLPKSSN